MLRQVKGMTTEPVVNIGKGIDEVAARQRRRKVCALRESCRSALWFADTFKVDLLKVAFQVQTDHITVNPLSI